jgi:hypothetical protein
VDPTVIGGDDYGPGSSHDYLDYQDYHKISDGTSGSRTFYLSGETPGVNNDRGSKYLASYKLTGPALRICNRVYKKRDGGVE